MWHCYSIKFARKVFMKRVLALMMLVSIIGGGLWLSQPDNRPALNRLQEQATQISREAGNRVSNTVSVPLRQAVRAPQPTGQELSKYEKMLCDMANEERRKRGLPPMKIAPALADVARGHSREMMQKAYFSHTSPTAARKASATATSSNTSARHDSLPRTSTCCKAADLQTDRSAISAARTRMDEIAGHRANILRTEPLSPDSSGVGIVVKNGSFWATQNFATPM
jgi:hypothetical protein